MYTGKIRNHLLPAPPEITGHRSDVQVEEVLARDWTRTMLELAAQSNPALIGQHIVARERTQEALEASTKRWWSEPAAREPWSTEQDQLKAEWLTGKLWPLLRMQHPHDLPCPISEIERHMAFEIRLKAGDELSQLGARVKQIHLESLKDFQDGLRRRFEMRLRGENSVWPGPQSQWPDPAYAADRIAPEHERVLPPKQERTADDESARTFCEDWEYTKSFGFPEASCLLHRPTPSHDTSVTPWMFELLMRQMTGPSEIYLEIRDQQCRATSWWTPSAESIRIIAQAAIEEGSLCEIGAGSGLAMRLIRDELRSQGAEVPTRAIDSEQWHVEAMTRWTEVEQGGPESLSGEEGALLIGWPPDNDMPSEALDHWKGELLLVVTDLWEKTSSRFIERVDREFELQRVIDLPHWPGIRDQLTIWRRSNRLGPHPSN